MLQEIRVLTGLHSGAALRLAAGDWQVGAHAGADVQISDWHHAPLLLRIGADGGVTVYEDGDAGQNPAAARTMTPLSPMRFDAIVLCVGDAAAAWPDDAELLRRLDADAQGAPAAPEAAPSSAATPAPAPDRAPATPAGPPRWLLATTVATSLVCGAAVMMLSQSSHADTLPERELTLRQVRQALADLHQPELEARAQGDLIVVRGLVGNSADANAVRRMLGTLAPTAGMLNIAVVSEVVANIEETLHDSHLKVSYQGHGNFAVDGTSAHAEAVGKTVAQLAADSGATVRHIAVHVDAPRADWAIGNNDSALATDALQYVQAQDGTKQFFGGRP